jgi:hypothetical protein
MSIDVLYNDLEQSRKTWMEIYAILKDGRYDLTQPRPAPSGAGYAKRRGTGYSTRPERLEGASSLKVCPSHDTPENITDGANAPSGLRLRCWRIAKANLPQLCKTHAPMTLFVRERISWLERLPNSTNP